MHGLLILTSAAQCRSRGYLANDIDWSPALLTDALRICDAEPSGSRDTTCMVVALGDSVSGSKQPRDGKESRSEKLEDMLDGETGSDENM